MCGGMAISSGHSSVQQRSGQWGNQWDSCDMNRLLLGCFPTPVRLKPASPVFSLVLLSSWYLATACSVFVSQNSLKSFIPKAQTELEEWHKFLQPKHCFFKICLSKNLSMGKCGDNLFRLWHMQDCDWELNVYQYLSTWSAWCTVVGWKGFCSWQISTYHLTNSVMLERLPGIS